MRIGVDVGGTNTDAALLSGRKVIASVKSPTTTDVATGVVRAIREVMSTGQVESEAIDNVMIGTTQFTNAFVERRHLNEVAVIRLCLPAGKSLRPLIDWPPDLVDAIGQHVYLCDGGYEFDGQQIRPVDENQILKAARDIRKQGVTSVAIAGIFSPINDHMERQAADIIQNELPEIAITLSSELGRVGLIERENAAVMNASLSDLSTRVVQSFRSALNSLGITAPFFISQNDGTLMSADFVERYPVLTFASGPTNSMRGAAYLSNKTEAIVVDIGGTTTDVGVLSNGFPRESALAVDIGGVRTNFRMPDLLSIGLGGGSLVREGDSLAVGPRSVGYQLPEKALIFGGDTITATDIAVAAGYADLGDRNKVASLDGTLVDTAVEVIHRMAATAIDRVKTSSEDVDVVLVGGGSILIDRPLAGVKDLVIPDRSAEANAIGAAIAQVGGETDAVFHYEDLGRETALDQARNEASEKAIAAGADPATIEIVEVEEIPLSYAPRGAVRIRVKAVGDLATAKADIAGE